MRQGGELGELGQGVIEELLISLAEMAGLGKAVGQDNAVLETATAANVRMAAKQTFVGKVPFMIGKTPFHRRVR